MSKTLTEEDCRIACRIANNVIAVAVNTSQRYKDQCEHTKLLAVQGVLFAASDIAVYTEFFRESEEKKLEMANDLYEHLVLSVNSWFYKKRENDV